MRILIVSLKSQTEALLPKTLRGMRRSWDWAIAVQGDPRSVLLAKHLARRQTSPVGGLGLRSLWGRLIVSDAAEAESCAPFDRMSSLLAPIAGRAVQPNEVVPVHPAAQSVSEALEGKIRGHRFVLFLTRPRLPLLAWPEDHWRRLASHAARKGLLVVWAEPQPEDESGVSPREPRCESLSAFAGALSLGQIVELARRAAVCVGVDSVEFQAAAAAGAHVLALFGPSLPSSWGASPDPRPATVVERRSRRAARPHHRRKIRKIPRLRRLRRRPKLRAASLPRSGALHARALSGGCRARTRPNDG